MSTSLIANPSFEGEPPSYLVTFMNPERAFIMRSNVGDNARRLESPYPDIETYIKRGFICERVS